MCISVVCVSVVCVSVVCIFVVCVSVWCVFLWCVSVVCVCTCTHEGRHPWKPGVLDPLLEFRQLCDTRHAF